MHNPLSRAYGPRTSQVSLFDPDHGHGIGQRPMVMGTRRLFTRTLSHKTYIIIPYRDVRVFALVAVVVVMVTSRGQHTMYIGVVGEGVGVPGDQAVRGKQSSGIVRVRFAWVLYGKIVHASGYDVVEFPYFRR
ncbi:hypothetical protein QTP88_020192 [Uroleucon formosanum]